MAVPTTRIVDDNPECTYRCARCNQDVRLSGYRVLYRGTKRPLRCRACEAATATPQMARYYAQKFERSQQNKRDYAQRRPEVARAARERYSQAHAEEVREYKAAWYHLNGDRARKRSLDHYYANREARRAQDKARYAARHRTPEAVAARAAAREQRKRARRAAWRAEVRAAVAAYFSTTVPLQPDELLASRRDQSIRGQVIADARRVALYCTWVFHRTRDRHPKEEIAGEYGLSTRSLAIIIGQTRAAIRRRRTEPDGMDIYVALKAVCGVMGLRFGPHGAAAPRRRLEKAS